MCPGYIVALIEFLNKFAVSHHAVTAAPFCTSARQITAILARNALSVYVVDQIGGAPLAPPSPPHHPIPPLSHQNYCSALGPPPLPQRTRTPPLPSPRASGFVLHFGAFVLSGLVAGLTTALVASTLPATVEEEAVLLGVYMGLSFVVAFSTLNFLATLLLNVVDAAYTCHALDLEVGNLCTPACNPKRTSLQPHVPNLQPRVPSL